MTQPHTALEETMKFQHSLLCLSMAAFAGTATTSSPELRELAHCAKDLLARV